MDNYLKWLLCVAIGYTLMRILVDLDILSSCIDFFKHRKKKGKLEMDAQTTQVRIRIQKIYGKARYGDKKVLWKYELKDCDGLEPILLDLAKSAAEYTDTSAIIYSVVDVIEEDGAMTSDYEMLLPERFLLQYLNDRMVWKEGKLVKCRKLHFPDETKYYDIYFDLFSDHDLDFIAEEILFKKEIIWNHSLEDAIREIKEAEMYGVIILCKEKDASTIINEYTSRVMRGTEDDLTELEVEIHKDLNKKKAEDPMIGAKEKYPKLTRLIRGVDERLARGEEIPGISINKWELYRTEILALLKRELDSGQQERVWNILNEISQIMAQSEKDRESLDTDVTIEAIENAVALDVPGDRKMIGIEEWQAQG